MTDERTEGGDGAAPDEAPTAKAPAADEAPTAKAPAADEAPTAKAPAADEAPTASAPASREGAGVAAAEDRPTAGRGRRIAAWSLVVVASLLLVLGIFAVWLNRQLLNTDNWTNTSTQLLENKDIREQLADYLVAELYANVDVSGEIESVLPKQAAPLAGPAASGLKNLATEAANAGLESSQFQNLWRNANRVAHTQFVNLVEGNDVGPLQTSNGKVTLDLATIVSSLAADVGIPQSLIQKIPPDVGQLEVMDSQAIATAQDATSVFRALLVVLWILIPLMYALAIYLAVGYRRRLLVGAGLGFAAAALVVFVAKNLVGNAVVDGLATTEAVKPAAEAAWSIGTSLLVQAAQGALFVGVALLIAAWVGGRSRPATALRRAAAPYLRDRADITWGVTAAFILLLALWGPTPAARTISGMLLFAIVIVIGVVALRRETAREFPDARIGSDDPGMMAKVGAAAATGGRAAAGAVGRARESVTSRPKPAPALPPASDRYAEIERLASMRDRGVLTDEEFAAEKAALLASAPPAD